MSGFIRRVFFAFLCYEGCHVDAFFFDFILFYREHLRDFFVEFVDVACGQIIPLD